MQICPRCFTTYANDEVQTCTADGEALVPEATFAHVDRDVPEGTIVGEYRIETKLGAGGFGAVYRAVHPLIGKMAAVKVLSREFSSNPQMVSRFIAEARAVNQIRHRNIIDIFSFGQLADGRQYYIMELLEGASFDAYLANRKRLSLEEALPILRGVARALDAAHGKNLLHRDLKPENVFLVFDEDGKAIPKLLDFGLVKLLADAKTEHKTKTGTPMGTPYYMSPEQCRGFEVDARTDVYSFGALCFEVLTGEVPFTGGSTMDILVQHMTSAVPSASSRCPDLPPRVDDAIARMMAKEPRERPASAGEALDLLTGEVRDSARGALALPPSAADPRAVARTEIAPYGAQTFLGGAETEVVPVRSARPIVFAAVAFLMLAVGALSVVFLTKRPARTEGVVQATASSTSTSTSEPSSVAAPDPNVDLRIEGAPDGALVVLNGVDAGKAPGPFKVKKGEPLKLVVTAKGYKPRELAITPTESVLLPLTLDKAASNGAHHPSAQPTIHSDLAGFDDKK